jgi:hypothetical protein
MVSSFCHVSAKLFVLVWGQWQRCFGELQSRENGDGYFRPDN